MEYDLAIRDFRKALEARPDEPKALNHLLEARLFQQLYKYNALDTRLYTKQRFLTSKQVPIEATAKKQLAELTEQAMAASEKRLRNDPRWGSPPLDGKTPGRVDRVPRGHRRGLRTEEAETARKYLGNPTKPIETFR